METPTGQNPTPTPGWLRRIAIGKKPRYTAVRIVVLVVVCVIVANFVLVPIRVIGQSMHPTYRDGSVNFVNRLAYLFHEPRRGDVVAIRYSGKHMMLMKRIVGLPGETVSFYKGFVVINGEQIDEPYLRVKPEDWQQAPKTLGPDEYYVVGDNRTMPLVDHYEGRAARKRIIGKVLL
jgi:signal peptidase I